MHYFESNKYIFLFNGTNKFKFMSENILNTTRMQYSSVIHLTVFFKYIHNAYKHIDFKGI